MSKKKLKKSARLGAKPAAQAKPKPIDGKPLAYAAGALACVALCIAVSLTIKSRIVTTEKVDEAVDEFWTVMMRDRFDDYYGQTFPGPIEDLCLEYGLEYIMDDDGMVMHQENIQTLKDYLYEYGTMSDLKHILELAETESTAGSNGMLSFSIDTSE